MVKKLIPAAVAALLLASAPSFAADKLHWITLGDAAYKQLQKMAPQAIAKHSVMADNGAQSLADGEKAHLVQVSEKQMFALSHAVHHELKRCGGFMFHPTEAAGRAALAGRNNLLAVKASRPSYAITQQSTVNAVLPNMQASNIAQTINDLSNFVNRYYQTQGGVDASAWLMNKWKTIAGSRTDISVAQFTHASWKQKSVIVTINGTDNPNEIVVLGGHLDSINTSGTTETTRAPGADDDASGIATMTEVLRALVANGYKPRRTIKMMAYAAEEVGLRGSQEIANSFASSNANVVGVMQLDMTNYKGGANDIYLFTDYTDVQQTAFVKNLITTYLPGVTVGSDKCGYACSDHASWFNKGYFTTMPFESPMNSSNPYIHTVNDTFANSRNQADHALKFAKMAAAFAIELGSQGAAPPSGDRTETFSGSLARGASKSFGPFKLAANGTFKASTTGSGDIDLYVKKGGVPTTTSYSCKSDGSTSTETCSTTSTTNTDVYVLVYGYTAGNYNLTVTYKAQ
ncbi:M20/M25/M40 family metallo-hydrolase [Massilia sp. W12]|uniref:M20/M25/M40 family metallo-hydrolase n=1 Tax=Massilia sp. W12 TaxID=3126507 RepID=UPI0030CB2764